MNKLYLYIGGVVAAVLMSGALTWFIFATGSVAPAQTQNSDTFGSLSNNTSGASNTSNTSGVPTNTPQTTAVQTSQQKIFKISDGPVAGATFVQMLRPTTTVARFVMADNGHAFDLVLDSQGAVPKALSNTTIPGALSTAWVEKGDATVLQYLDGVTPKTVYLKFAAASTTTNTPAVRLQFYPDGIISLAGSPDGTQVAYLLRSTGGVDGYVTKSDGTGSKKLFSLPLGQVQLRWPSQGTLLAYSNSAAGVAGIAFAIDTKTAVITPLVYAEGLTATADSTFSHVLYQTTQSGSSVRSTYSHDVKAGTDRALSFDPFPEQCIQNPLSPSVMYCATPISYVAANYLDLWHQGNAGAADSLFAFNLASGTSTMLASPGNTTEGGVATDMLSIAASPDGHYLLFVSKYDRSLWGVRITQ